MSQLRSITHFGQALNPIASYGVVIFTKTSEWRFPLLYRVPYRKGAWSACGKVNVLPVRVVAPDDHTDEYSMPNQYQVFVNGKRVPEHQYSIVWPKAKRRTKQRWGAS